MPGFFTFLTAFDFSRICRKCYLQINEKHAFTTGGFFPYLNSPPSVHPPNEDFFSNGQLACLSFFTFSHAFSSQVYFWLGPPSMKMFLAHPTFFKGLGTLPSFPLPHQKSIPPLFFPLLKSPLGGSLSPDVICSTFDCISRLQLSHFFLTFDPIKQVFLPNLLIFCES